MATSLSTTQSKAVHEWHIAHESVQLANRRLLQWGAGLVAALGILATFSGLIATANSVQKDLKPLDRPVYTVQGNPTPEGGSVYIYDGKMDRLPEPVYTAKSDFGALGWLFWGALVLALVMGVAGTTLMAKSVCDRKRAQQNLATARTTLINELSTDASLFPHFLKAPGE